MFVFNLSYANDKNNEKPIKVVAVGDIADCRDGQSIGVKTTSNIIKSISPDIFFPLGDLVYPEASEELLKKCYGKYLNFIKNRTYPTIGNHEYYSEAGKNYNEYFSDNLKIIDKESNYSGQKNNKWPNYFKFDKGNWTFISLDTNKEMDEEEQINWIKNVYKTKNKCTIILMHHPYTSKGLRTISPRAKNIIQEIKNNPPTIVLTGHDHHYQESKLINGTKHYLVGTGGVKINTFVNPLNLDTTFSDFNYGVLSLKLFDNRYEADFITKDGSISNTTGDCSHD